MPYTLTSHLYDTSGVIDSTGSANAYVVTVDWPINAYHRGMPPIRFKANFSNTGAATLNVATINAPSGLGATAIRRRGGGILSPGNISSGGIYTAIYDGTRFQLLELNAAGTGAFINVQDYGALGDGTTNDYAAFAAAIAAASSGGGAKRVYVPHTDAGYVLGDTVAIPEGVVIFGDNLKHLQLSRIKPAAAFSDPLFESDDYGNTRKLRIGLQGLYLDGSATTLTAIRVNCQESVFRDLRINNCFTYGLHLGGVGSGGTQQALNNLIADCHLAGIISTTEFFDGIFIDYYSADNTITQCYVEACKDAGIRSRGYNNKITNNHIYSVAGTGGGVGAGIYCETGADHDISQNYIELCAAEAILMAGGGSDVATMAAAIHGNVLRNIDTGNTSNGAIEVSGSDVSGVSISGNVVRRDAATSYATPYLAYFNGITPSRAKVYGNEWQSGVVTTGQVNIATNTKLIASGSLSGSSVDITNIPPEFSQLLLSLSSYSFSGAGANLRIQGSDNNGSSFDTTAGNYAGIYHVAGASPTTLGEATFADPGALTNATDTGFVNLMLRFYQTSGARFIDGNTTRIIASVASTRWHQTQWFGGSGGALNAIRLAPTAGTFDGGTYSLTGIL